MRFTPRMHTLKLKMTKQKKTKNINRYRKLPDELKKRIRDHYDYCWRRKTVYDEKGILLELPTSLRSEVSLFLNRDLIVSVPFLRDLGEDCTAHLVTKLLPLQIPPHSFVFKRGSFGREMFFLSEGEVEVISSTGKVICILGPGSYFGEYAILSDQPTKRTASIRARTFVDLFSLSKEDFDDVVELYPEVYNEIIENAKEQWQRLVSPFGSSGGSRRRRRKKSRSKHRTSRTVSRSSRRRNTQGNQSTEDEIEMGEIVLDSQGVRCSLQS